MRIRGMCFLLLPALLAAGCSAFSADSQLQRQTAVAEKRELWEYKKQACEDASDGAWMCSGASENAAENYPWLHCSCVDNRRVLD